MWLFNNSTKNDTSRKNTRSLCTLKFNHHDDNHHTWYMCICGHHFTEIFKNSFYYKTKLSFSGNYTPPPRNLQFCQNYCVDVLQPNSKSLNTCLGIWKIHYFSCMKIYYLILFIIFEMLTLPAPPANLEKTFECVLNTGRRSGYFHIVYTVG